MREVHIIGVPLDLGSGRRGVDMGPSALRIAGLGQRVGALGYRVVDQGNIETPVVETKAHGDTNKRYIEEISRVCEGLYRTALASPARCQSCWVAIIAWELGRSAQPPAGPPSNQSRIGLLWIDAHADMNTPVTTLTGKPFSGRSRPNSRPSDPRHQRSTHDIPCFWRCETSMPRRKRARVRPVSTSSR